MKNLTRTYVVALTIIALVISASQFLVQRSITDSAADSRVINISGRQRMLSQKITKAALAMDIALDQQQYLQRKIELENAFALWTKSHNALLNGDDELNLPVPSNSEAVLNLFSDLKPHYDAIRSNVEVILSYEFVEGAQESAFDDALAVVLSSEAPFLVTMNDIVFQYDSEALGKVTTLSNTEYVLYAIALILLILEAFVIFRPAIRQISIYTKKLSDSLSQQKYLTAQAESIFDNVSQGIFMIDEQMTIDSFYSKVTEEIFDKESLNETNFLKLLKPRLLPQDVEALEMFVENLFNPEIREDVVNRLNPVGEVELFNQSENDVDIRSKFVKIKFSRILKDEQIHRVLVNVVDETEQVMMMRQIEEADIRNQQESTQLLAVLKVNPRILRDYIKETMVSLKKISSKYESHVGPQFENLISYTYSIVHTAKGNASLIGLGLIESKLHDVEDDLEQLRKLKEISGKDFVRIIYKTTEVIGVLDNMKEMLQKIAVVYKQMADGEQPAESNELFVDTLHRGVAKLSKELNKEVKLQIKENDVIIPEEFRVSVKDIAIQLIRNSLIHGIEGSDERQFAGKSQRGNIYIDFNTTEKGFHFRYRDDGAGLDFDKIRNRAIELGLYDLTEVPDLSDKQLAGLIFSENFSTAENVTNNAGRGQGMNIVRRQISKHRGVFSVKSLPGKSFSFSLILPTRTQLRSAS